LTGSLCILWEPQPATANAQSQICNMCGDLVCGLRWSPGERVPCCASTLQPHHTRLRLSDLRPAARGNTSQHSTLNTCAPQPPQMDRATPHERARVEPGYNVLRGHTATIQGSILACIEEQGCAQPRLGRRGLHSEQWGESSRGRQAATRHSRAAPGHIATRSC